MLAGHRTGAETFALIFGLVYVLIALLGVAVTGFITDFASQSGDKLIIFELNPLHNIAHLVVGGLLLWSTKSHATARVGCLIVGIAFLVLALLGFAGILVDKLLSVNASDNVLHLATAVLALYFGTMGAEG